MKIEILTYKDRKQTLYEWHSRKYSVLPFQPKQQQKVNDLFVIKEKKQSADFTPLPHFHKMLHQTQHSIVCLSLMGMISRKWSRWHELKKFSNDNQQIFFSNMALPLKPVDSYHLSFASSHLCPGWTTIC